jgi:hypothetical protein
MLAMNTKPVQELPRPLGYHYRPVAGCDYSESQEGVTLRDYFAAKAMSVFVLDLQTCEQNIDHPDRKALMEKIASEAYKMADAMLKAR